jgi:two-component system phosphate regulon sensor histidine kinase PhoR
MTYDPRLLIYTLPELTGLLDQAALITAGYEVTTVFHPQDVETWLKSSRYDSLLILALPSTSESLEYSQALLFNHPLLPIILVGNETDQACLKRALEIGITDCLTTPIDSTSLLSAIDRSMTRLKSRQTLPFAQIVNELVDGLLLVDINYRLLLVNPAVRKIFDVEDGKLEGKTVDEIFHHPELLDIFTPYRTFPYHNEISMEDGRVFSTHSSMIPDTGIVVIMHEITQLKELDRIKTEFVNTVSHDLRSPLTAVYGFIGLIDRVGPINQQQAEFIKHIQSSLQHITSLINDLLELGRLEAGYDVLVEEVKMTDILNQAMGNLEYQYNEKMQYVTLEIPEEIPVILGNPLHLQRMVTNLIENAIKFTPAMGKIDIRCRPEAEQLILEVSDNGPGIPLDDQPHIFEKFYRGSNMLQETSGTGLGLSIVKSIVDKHHGRIWLESAPGGTTFTVILPLK